MFNQNGNTPPIPERSIGGDTGDFIGNHLKKRSVFIENSESRIMARIIKHLGESDPVIKDIVQNARTINEEKSKQFLKELSLPKMLCRNDLPCLETAEDNIMEGVLPRLASLKVKIDPRELATRTLNDVWNACTVACPRLNGWPNWGSEEYSNEGQYYWYDWTSKPTTVSCIAGVSGRGRLQDEWVSNTARWYWLFTPSVSENLDVWISHRLSGPCSWRRNGGDVSVWIMTEVKVEKYMPRTSTWQVIKTLPRTIRLLYSTNSGLDMNGPPPQGYFGGTSDAYVGFAPSDQGFAIGVEEDHFHLVGVDVTIALTANENAGITVGKFAGSNFEPCEIKSYSTLCRCT
ncbi:MAG: hypothetical protein KKD44_11285 [Proteobacteria bacterium]|nr:hypothetical protein [Pseudomonadota bacterium]